VAQKTGYPRDMLELDLDLEADLGIDTVKQAEVFGMVREHFNIPRQDNIKLREYPTLKHVIGFVRQNRPDLALSVATPAGVAESKGPNAPVAAPTAAASGTDPVAEKVLSVVSEKTGYPRDMLELDLDLEADLGIDTVKQAEVFGMVREAFGIPRQDDIKLREYPTLKHVIGFVRKFRPDLALSVASAVAESKGPDAPAPIQAPQSPAPFDSGTASAVPTLRVSQTAGGDAVEDRVLSLVSEKTGYPRDMLELDLDLEADLGIDTVKQAEIFGMVRESFGIPRQDNIKLREYPTIRHVIGFVRQMNAGGRKPADATLSVATAESKGPAADGALFRLPVPVLRPTLDACKATAARLEQGRGVVVVSDSGGAGAALATALEGRGLRVLRIDDRPQPKELEARIAGWARSGPVAGAYFLRALDPDRELSEMDLAAWRSLHQDGVKSLCALSRALYAALGEKGTFLLSATRLGGVHGYDALGARFPAGGAVTGFTKALARERTGALVKAVDFEEGAKAEEVARALLAETERDPGAVEIGYRGGLRFGIAALSEEPPATAEPLALGSDTVFLVAGGAGGITAAIVRDLAAASKGTFHLLGTRPMPDEATKQMVAKLANREALQREIFEALKAGGARATPAAVEKRVFELERSASILETVRGIEQAGGKAHYHAVDIVREDAVRELVKGIGKVDVLIHAAGLERSRSLETKPVEEFDRIFEVKADGLFNLLRASGSQLKALVGFSSVAGRFGNAGQTDYSAGNDLLCKVASRWAAQKPGRLAFVADWSAWGEIGMAARGNIPELMKRAGIEMLSPAEGVPVVRQMLARGFSGEAVVGRGLGGLFAPLDPDGGLDPKAFAEAANNRQTALAIAGATLDLHRGLEVSLTLDPKREPFLYDHQIDGTPVLPGVMGLEGFAEVGTMLAPGLRVSEIRDVRFLAPLKYFRQEPRLATFRALPLWNREGGLGVRVSLSSAQPAPGSAPVEKTHFVATLLLEKDEGKVKAPKMQPAAASNGHRLGHDDIYRVYFHGPAYQVLSEVMPAADGGVLGAMARELPADTSDPARHHLFAPRLVELCFQTAGVWEIGKTGRLGLPAAVERVKVFGAPKKGAGLVAEVAVRNLPAAAGGELQFDARVRDEKGHVYVEVQGYRTAQLPGGVPDEQLRPFQSVTAR